MLVTPALAESFRVALFHTEFGRDGPGLFYRDILRGKDPQIEAGLRILRHIDADLLILGDIDHDHHRVALDALADRLGTYPHRFHPVPNRGVPSGLDLNGNGRLGDDDDRLGYGPFRGSGSIAVLSRFSLRADLVEDRTALPWLSLDGHIAPEGTPPNVPLSTTVYLRLPVELPDGALLNLILWHATPPVFDGPEDRNGRRNHDEARLVHEMLDATEGTVLIAGFANLDPVDGDGRKEALRALLAHPRLQDRPPESAGGRDAALEAGVNVTHRGDPARDTVDWPDEPGRPGNLRTDYLLPERSLTVLGSGVFWPEEGALFGGEVRSASRHRILWMDLVPDSTGKRDDRVGWPEIGQERVEFGALDPMRQ